MLPKKDGFSVLRALRQEGKTVPVLMLSARSELSDRVEGLDCGADYYLTKPFEPKELLACVRMLTRRQPEQRASNVLEYGDLRLEPDTFELACGERSVRLSRKEFDMMELLLRSREMVLTKESLIVKLWGYESDAEDNNVEVYISFLRKKLEHLRSRVKIRTIRMVGYRLETQEADNRFSTKFSTFSTYFSTRGGACHDTEAAMAVRGACAWRWWLTGAGGGVRRRLSRGPAEYRGPQPAGAHAGYPRGRGRGSAARRIGGDRRGPAAAALFHSEYLGRHGLYHRRHLCQSGGYRRAAGHSQPVSGPGNQTEGTVERLSPPLSACEDNGLYRKLAFVDMSMEQAMLARVIRSYLVIAAGGACWCCWASPRRRPAGSPGRWSGLGGSSGSSFPTPPTS